MLDTGSVAEHFARLRTEITALTQETACASDGCNLIAVSKMVSLPLLHAAYDCGQRDFGENYVQELLEKRSELPSDIRWHFIGHLQRNKVKYLIPWVYAIHSVDSLSLATEINKHSVQHQVATNVFLQLNLAGEAQKGGFDPQNLANALPELTTLKNLRILGLMLIPPLEQDPESNRSFFAELKKKSEMYRAMGYPVGPALSMGMSADYRVAISEGATHVRIGSLLFGARP